MLIKQLLSKIFEDIKLIRLPHNIFLVVLIFVSVFSALLLSYNKAHDFGDTSRVVSVGRGYFNQEQYYVSNGSKVWRAKGLKDIEVGTNIKHEVVDVEYYDHRSGDYNSYLKSNGVSGEVALDSVLINSYCDSWCKVLRYRQDLVGEVNYKLSQGVCNQSSWITERLYSGSCQDVYALSYGLILGGADKFGETVKQKVKDLGLSHLVAVSGFQVVLLMILVEWIAIRMFLDPKMRFLLVGLFIFFLVMIVGPQPPVLRAGLSTMLTLYFLAFHGRLLSGLRSLIYSGAIMLLVNPFYIWSISFQLSFVASFALIMIGGDDYDWEVSWLKEVGRLVQAPLYAYLFTLPIVLLISDGSSPLAVLLNALVAPFVPIVTILLMLSLIPSIGQIFMFFAVGIQSLMLEIVEIFYRIIDVVPGIGGSFGVFQSLVYYLMLFVLIYIIKSFRSVASSDK